MDPNTLRDPWRRQDPWALSQVREPRHRFANSVEFRHDLSSDLRLYDPITIGDGAFPVRAPSKRVTVFMHFLRRSQNTYAIVIADTLCLNQFTVGYP
jgi:hypothetical protein